METIRGHIMPYARGRDAGHVMTRLSRSIRDLESRGYTTEAVSIWPSTRDDDGYLWSGLAMLQNPATEIPAVDSPHEVEAR